jgi:hypothetical protein
MQRLFVSWMLWDYLLLCMSHLLEDNMEYIQPASSKTAFSPVARVVLEQCASMPPASKREYSHDTLRWPTNKPPAVIHGVTGQLISIHGLYAGLQQPSSARGNRLT